MKKLMFILAVSIAVGIWFTGCNVGEGDTSTEKPVPVPTVKEYTVLFGCTDGNGELIAKEGEESITSSAKIAEGKTVKFTAKPKSGYVVDTWMIEGAEFETGTGKNYSDTASVKISGNITVKVGFKTKKEGWHAVSFASSGNGTLTARIQGGDVIASGNEVKNDETVEFLAAPAQHCKVKSFAVMDTATEKLLTAKSGGHITETSVPSPAEVVIKGAVTVKVEFDEITYNLSLTAVSGNGTFTVMSDGKDITSIGKVPENEMIEITVKPNEGYSIDKWKITGGTIEGGTIVDGSPTARVKVGTSAIEVAVTFKWTKDDGTFIPKKTYRGNTKLRCFLPRLNKDFAVSELKSNSKYKPLLEDAYITVDDEGNATLTAKFIKTALEIFINKESNIFIDPRKSKPGYYDMNGVKQDVPYTISSDDTANDPAGQKVHYVTSMTFPVSKDASLYYLWLYINSDTFGVQFCDGNGQGNMISPPNTPTGYKAEFTVDWASFKPE